MKTYRAHQNVEPGIYLNLRHVTFRSLDEAGRLPATPEGTWRRVPALALLVVGPLMGLAYAIFLPLIGFAMLGGVLLRKAGELGVEAAHAGTRVLRPAWQPAQAFLSRGRKAPKTEAKAETKSDSADRWAEDAARELDETSADESER